MAVHVNVTASTLKKCENNGSKLHLMPCLIKSNDVANVSNYFEPVIFKQPENDVLAASFRGHPLLGKEVRLPGEYLGLVIEETTPEKMNEEVERNFYVTRAFDKFTYWNWDRVPSANDKLISALQWIEISKALHSSIIDSE